MRSFTVDARSEDEAIQKARMALYRQPEFVKQVTAADDMRVEKIRAVSLADLLDRHDAPATIDYLSLDVEGYEYEILRSFPFGRYRFRCMTIERPAKALRRLLTRAGYIPVSYNGVGGDVYYIHSSLTDSYFAVQDERTTLNYRTSLGLLDYPSVEDQLHHERQARSLLEAASRDLESVIPPGTPLILVDDQQLDATDLAPRRRVYPFLERDGAYDGPPADSATAIEQLERLRHDGARFFVIAWPSFWWVECYPGLMAYLRQRYRCVLENERLIVFDLRAA